MLVLVPEQRAESCSLARLAAPLGACVLVLHDAVARFETWCLLREHLPLRFLFHWLDDSKGEKHEVHLEISCES